jgi:hypothetical protein
VGTPDRRADAIDHDSALHMHAVLSITKFE